MATPQVISRENLDRGTFYCHEDEIRTEIQTPSSRMPRLTTSYATRHTGDPMRIKLDAEKRVLKHNKNYSKEI